MSGGVAIVTVQLGTAGEASLRAALAGWDADVQIVSRHPTMAEIVAAVAPMFDLAPSQITGCRGSRRASDARALVAWFAHRHTERNFTAIGQGLSLPYTSARDRITRACELFCIDDAFRHRADALVDHFGYGDDL